MTVKIGKTNLIIAEQEFTRVEKSLRFSFPKDYKEFINAHNGGDVETNVFKNSENGSGSGVSKFIEFRRLVAVYNDFKSRIPPGVFPIAFAEGGNLVCLSEKGAVYYWDRKSEGTSDVAGPENMFLISKSVTSFLKELQKPGLEDAGLKPGRVKSA